MRTTEKKDGHIHTVSTLTREIKSILEDRFPFIWISGEISNYALPASGHSYFSLKDDKALISCVMFRNQKSSLKFSLENGIKIVGLARLSLYEPRGSYQLIFEHIEPDGAGSLQMAFEQLKKKLSSQGLFDEVHKKKLPFLPAKISVITSGTGAAVRDIIQVSGRRLPSCRLEIVPVKVQGEKSENKIALALNMVNENSKDLPDLVIIARGGGSIEDLWAFNTEIVARAIFASKVPVVTGIGHETDFTIADFAADLRAPTPSAAAELALPDKASLAHRITGFQNTLNQKMIRKLDRKKLRLDDLALRLKSPGLVIADFKSRIIANLMRMDRTIKVQVQAERDQLAWIEKDLDRTKPDTRTLRQQVDALTSRLGTAMTVRAVELKSRATELTHTLETLNPESVLKRGYSITRKLPGKTVVLNSQELGPGDRLEIILSKGRLVTRVE